MTENAPEPRGTGSLTVQVMQAEMQLLRRRQRIGECASALGRRVRRRLTSPVALLLAAGVGFAAGFFGRRPVAAPGNEAPTRAFRNRLFAGALHLFGVARALFSAFPASAMNLFARSASPGPDQPE
ncbi:MAG TPA: hypothetical protein VMP00_11850 [Burkholderiales bacterium]|nr:hypothetical protein [Burkholderiales bacterium]